LLIRKRPQLHHDDVIDHGDGSRLRAEVFARQEGVVAGLPLLAPLFARLDPMAHVETVLEDGDRITGLRKTKAGV